MSLISTNDYIEAILDGLSKEYDGFIPRKNNFTSIFCDTCICAKLHQLPFHNSNTIYSTHLELVFIDIWGFAPLCATCGGKYYVAFLDTYACYTWKYLLNTKSQIVTIFIQFKSFVRL